MTVATTTTTYPRPNGRNTGPRWTQPLTPYVGPLRFDGDTVLTRIAWSKPIHVAAGTLTIRDSRYRADGRTIRAITTSGTGRVVLDHVEADGAGIAEIFIDAARTRLVWCNVYGFNDAVRLVHDNVIRHCWIHGAVRIGALHDDTIQSIGGTDVEIAWNALDCRSTPDATPDNGLGLGNACVMLGNEKRGPRHPESVLDRILIAHNWLDGGNMAINVRDDLGVGDDIVIRDNVFGGTHRHGAIKAPARLLTKATGNVMHVPAPLTRTT